MKAITATDRKALIRLASTMPVGSDERKAILAGLKMAAVDFWPTRSDSRRKDILPEAIKIFGEPETWNDRDMEGLDWMELYAQKKWNKQRRLTRNVLKELGDIGVGPALDALMDDLKLRWEDIEKSDLYKDFSDLDSGEPDDAEVFEWLLDLPNSDVKSLQ